MRRESNLQGFNPRAPGRRPARWSFRASRKRIVDEPGVSLVFADLRGFAQPGRGRARHGDAWGPARDLAVSAPDLRGRRRQRLRGGAHTHRIVVRGRLVDDGDADRGHRDTEIPGRLPPWTAQPNSGRADGRDLPAALGRTP